MNLLRSVLVSASLFASCAVGPDYPGPPDGVDAAWKNAGFTAAPPEGSWWNLFHDAELSRLIREAERHSPTVEGALARYDRARADLGLARVDAYPSLTGNAYARRQSDSGNSNFPSGTYNDYRGELNLSWELDLWGRVRRQIGAAAAEERAAAYDYQGALLSLRGELARTYLSLRFTDADIALLERTAGLRVNARRLMKLRYEQGASSRLDHERAITEHEAVVAELAEARAERGRLENAVAALVGRGASSFRILPDGARPTVPRVPAGVPSDLLRRRPDLAAAERRLAAASERIGLVIASYLPRINLGAGGGVNSLNSSELFDSGSLLWSLGPELQLPVFQGGALGANKRKAEAAYREALANYRDTLLRGVRETEDALSDGRRLTEAAAARSRGAVSAGHAADLTRKQFKGGVTDYFEVVDADRTSLSQERAALATEQARVLAAARLIQALGGGWSQ